MPLLLFKLATLFSFCGGPLLVCELLKPRLGQDPAFVVGMAPVALMAYGALTMRDGDDSRVVVWLGAIGAVVVLAFNLFAAWHLGTHSAVPDAGLISFGIGIGWIAGMAYLAVARARLGALGLRGR